jgi:hypothetical protein
MDIGYIEETYEYYRAKQTKKNEEVLDIYDWARMKRREKNQPKAESGTEPEPNPEPGFFQ